MMNNAKRLLSLIIFLVGLAVVVRTIMAMDTISFTAGLVAGLAFMAFGAVRLYYLWDKP